MQREDTHRIFVRAKSLADQGNFQKALPLFTHLLKGGHRDPGRSAQILSYYGLSLAMVHGANREGLRLCEEAVRRSFFHPDIYLNLGKLYLKKGDKRKAMWAIEQGLNIDPSHPFLQAVQVHMGIRRPPPVPFLPRSHFLNRLLGRLTFRIALFLSQRRQDGEVILLRK